MKGMLTALGAILLLSLIPSCSGTEEDAAPPIFDDVSTIEATKSAGALGSTSTIDIKMPDVEYAYIVVGVFNSETIIVDPDLNLITNSENMICGIRSGMAGFTRTALPCAAFKKWNNPTCDFDVSVPASFIGERVWAVWAYDKDLNLVAASAALSADAD